MTLDSNVNSQATVTPHSKDPLHGRTLQTLLTELVEHYGWEELGNLIPLNCFIFDPSLASSLRFLRRTQWARKKVEDLYLDFHHHHKRPDDTES